MKQFNIEKMENYEVNEIKDDLVMLESQFEGSSDGDVIAKAFHYINYLEEKLVDIANDEKRAIKLLIENDYAVIKKSKGMLEDENECEEMRCKGEDKDCLECRCSICIMQY
jgi:hypothetical protein